MSNQRFSFPKDLSTSPPIFALTFINIFKNLKCSRLITLNQYIFKKNENKPSARKSSTALKESPQKKKSTISTGPFGDWPLAFGR
jgi:hypothetical protein